MKRLLIGIGIIVCIVVPSIRLFLGWPYRHPTGSMETTILAGDFLLGEKLTYRLRPPKQGELVIFSDPTHIYSSSFLINAIEQLFAHKWLKRIIGVPGDHIKGVIEDGKPVVYRNQKKLDESSYVNQYPLILIREKPMHELGRKGHHQDLVYRSFDPQSSWDTQPFYAINPELIVRNPETGEPREILEPHTPRPNGSDIYDVTLEDNEYWVMGDNRVVSGDSRDWGPLSGSLIQGRVMYTLWSAKPSRKKGV